MKWSEAETARPVDSYYAHWAHSDEPVPGEMRDQHWWAVERVMEEGLDGTLPLSVLEAPLKARQRRGRALLRLCWSARGPAQRPRRSLGRDVALRCEVDPLWAEAVAGVWLRRDQWGALPEALQRLVPEPERHLSKARRNDKRPSKRQQRRPRRG